MHVCLSDIARSRLAVQCLRRGSTRIYVAELVARICATPPLCAGVDAGVGVGCVGLHGGVYCCCGVHCVKDMMPGVDVGRVGLGVNIAAVAVCCLEGVGTEPHAVNSGRRGVDKECRCGHRGHWVVDGGCFVVDSGLRGLDRGHSGLDGGCHAVDSGRHGVD